MLCDCGMGEARDRIEGIGDTGLARGTQRTARHTSNAGRYHHGGAVKNKERTGVLGHGVGSGGHTAARKCLQRRQEGVMGKTC